MNTKESTREQISALADGELSEHELDAALAALRTPEARAEWDLYHRVGDMLRSDDMAADLSPGFSARFAARLDAEPTIIAPAAVSPTSAEKPPAAAGSARKWALPSMIAGAVMATAAFIATPQLMVAMKGKDPAEAAVKLASDTAQPAVVAASAPDGVVLRDARIDDYLLAHQRLSPSVYSTAQFARSAAFSTESGK